MTSCGGMCAGRSAPATLHPRDAQAAALLLVPNASYARHPRKLLEGSNGSSS